MRLGHRRRTHKKGATAQLAAQLAPLEELDKKSAARQLGGSAASASTTDSGFSAIVVDNNNLQVPKEILEEGSENTYMGMEPVVMVILAFMIVFIAFITWQISLMPAE
jgi:hypothetical protein